MSGDYLDQIQRAHAAGRVPVGVSVAQVFHDDWCALLAGRGECDCNPEVRVVPVAPKPRPKRKRRKKR